MMLVMSGVVLCLSPAASADGLDAPKTHQALHGGYFGDADDIYHYELLVDPSGLVILYVNNDKNEPLNVAILRARLTLYPDRDDRQSLAMQPIAGGEFFFTHLPPVTETTIHVEVAVQKDGVWAPLEFVIPREDHDV